MEKERNEQHTREKAKLAVARGNMYKDKFHTLRSRYDLVTAKQEEYRRELELANAKLKDVQAENDLLLDALGIAASSQPTLLQFLLPPNSSHPPREANGHMHQSLTAQDPLNGDLPRPRNPEAPSDFPDYAVRETNGRVP